MQEITKQYGGAILTCFVGFFLLVMLFFAWPDSSGTFLGSVGEEVDQSLDGRTVDWETHTDGTALNAHADRDLPTIQTKRHAKEKETITVTELFDLTDSDGRKWDSDTKQWIKDSDVKSGIFDILSIQSSGGEEFVDQTIDGELVWDRDAQELTFPEPDTFMVTVRVMDYDNVEGIYQIPVAVDMVEPDGTTPPAGEGSGDETPSTPGAHTHTWTPHYRDGVIDYYMCVACGARKDATPSAGEGSGEESSSTPGAHTHTWTPHYRDGVIDYYMCVACGARKSA